MHTPFSSLKRRWLILSALLFTLGISIFLLLEFFGVIWYNALFAARYQIKGLDVSHHQGQIDWRRVADTHRYTFVYIKATEGHDFVDDSFAENWQQAKSHGFLVGAYHFFSMRSSGHDQAELFIKTVPKDNAALPPVIDVEIDLSSDTVQVRNQLQDLFTELEKYYQRRPILYVTYDTYNTFIKGHFQDSNIWIRDVFKPPSIPEHNWFIWQYNNRGRVDGVPTYVDINALNGTVEDLMKS